MALSNVGFHFIELLCHSAYHQNPTQSFFVLYTYCIPFVEPKDIYALEFTRSFLAFFLLTQPICEMLLMQWFYFLRMTYKPLIAWNTSTTKQANRIRPTEIYTPLVAHRCVCFCGCICFNGSTHQLFGCLNGCKNDYMFYVNENPCWINENNSDNKNPRD